MNEKEVTILDQCEQGKRVIQVDGVIDGEVTPKKWVSDKEDSGLKVIDVTGDYVLKDTASPVGDGCRIFKEVLDNGDCIITVIG